MKQLLIITVAALLAQACGDTGTPVKSDDKSEGETAQSGDGSVLSGTISNAQGRKLVLEKWGMDGQMQTVAETVIADDGSFKLVSPQPELEYYRITLTPAQSQFDQLNVFLEGASEAVLNADGNDLFNSFTISGSEHTEVLVEYRNEIAQKLIPEMDSLRKVSGELPFDATEERQVVLDRMNEIKEEGQQLTQQFIDEHMGSPSVFFLLEQSLAEKAMRGAIDETDLEVVNKALAAFQEALPKSFWSTYASGRANEFASVLQKKNFLAPGTEAPDIAMTDREGKTRKLSDLRGKVVLLDFWASWCKPCRQDNPHVVEIYNKYKDAGFEIFSVSLDQEKAPWLAAIQTDQLTWDNHVSDLQGWRNAAAGQYGVNSIPFTVLLDKEGKVIEKGEIVRGHNLDAYMADIFGF